MPRPVKTKKDFVRRYARGEFGNASPTWDSFGDFYRDPAWAEKPGGLFHIRNRIAGGPTWYNVRRKDLADFWLEAVRRVGENNLYLSAMCPTQRTLIQGEVTRSWDGILRLTYSRVKKPMREALAENLQEAQGLSAQLLLLGHLNCYSYDWLQWLLEGYPGHTVEFTALNIVWGTVPHHNTLFWEVRDY